MNRNIRISILAVVLCLVAVFCASCGSDDGDTSGNAQNGVVSGDGSKGGVVSEVISKGEEVVSRVVDDISGVVSDAFDDNSNSSNEISADYKEETSFVSEGEVSNI